ncbi:MAG: LysE family transporter [Gemmatimonadota bacterium]
MIETIVTAILLGFFAGSVPGPFTTVVASTALERGFKRALKLAFVPVVTEIPALFATVFVLKKLNHDLLGAVGVLGGIAVAYLGVRFYQRQNGGDAEGLSHEDHAKEDRRTFQALATAGLLSPAPWIFWLVAAGPLFLRSWHASRTQGVVYVLVLLTMFVGTAAGIAWLASHGRKIMGPEGRARVIRAVGVLLVVVGGVLVWQSLEGNFQTLIKRQEALRESVEQH